MQSQEFRKILAIVHVVLAMGLFVISIGVQFQISDFSETFIRSMSDLMFLLIPAKGLVVILMAWAMTLVICGINLLKSKRRTMTQIISVINMFIFPVGTILGIVTLVSTFKKKQSTSILN